MNEALQVLLSDGVIDEVVARLKSGKEADVWLVSHAGEVVAAKVYKERDKRNFRNNSGYREGRQVRNSRTARAINRGSRFGQAAAEEAWKSAEADALARLHAAGVCVPRPVLFYEGVLLMELVLDLEGHPAPRMVEAQLTPEEARALYFDLRNQTMRMLCCDLIHGDLSVYNILLGNRGATIIDFPQVVDAAANSQAEFFFKRDLENLRRYFEAVDPSLRARAGDVHEIWRAYQRRELTPDFEPTGHWQAPAQERRSEGRAPNGRPPRQDGPGASFNRGEGRSGARLPNGRPPRQDNPGASFNRGESRSGERPPNGRPPRQDNPGASFNRVESRSGERPPNGRPPRQDNPGASFNRGESRSGERPPNGRPPRLEPAGGQFRRGERPAGPPREPRPQGRAEPLVGRSERGPRQGRGRGGGPQVSYKSAKVEDESGG